MSETVIRRPFTLEEMRQNEGVLTAVISYPWDPWDPDESGIDALNDFASLALTGSECALEDIGYKLVGVDVAGQELLLEVCGSVHNYLSEQEDDGEDDGEDDSED